MSNLKAEAKLALTPVRGEGLCTGVRAVPLLLPPIYFLNPHMSH